MALREAFPEGEHMWHSCFSDVHFLELDCIYSFNSFSFKGEQCSWLKILICFTLHKFE